VAKAGKRGGAATKGERVRQLLIAAGVVAALVFAVQGGEYGTTDLVRQKQRHARLVASIDSLQHVVDSLRVYERRLRTDPALQERIAREEFGMVRGDKELLYRFAEPEPDSSRVPRTP
jgi:cell division protein FtsB